MQTREISELIEFIKQDKIDELKKCLEENSISVKDICPFTKTSVAEFAAFFGNIEALECLFQYGFPLTTNEHGAPETALGILFWACLCEDPTQKKEFLTHLKNNYAKYKLNNDGLSLSHIKAALGELTTDDDSLISTDQFGLYPYHYAGLSGVTLFTAWVPTDLPNYEIITGKGIFEGVDLPWLIGRGGFKNFEDLKNIDLNSHPQSERHPSYNVSTVRLITLIRRYDLIKDYLEKNPKCILDLEAGNKTPTYEDPPLGLILAWEPGRSRILLNYLQANPDLNIDLNMKNLAEESPGYGVTLAWLFAAFGFFQYLNRHRPTAGYIDLNVAHLTKGHDQADLTVAHILVWNNQFELLEQYINDPQAPAIHLNTAPTSSNFFMYNASIAFLLAYRNRIDLLEMELRKHPQVINLNSGIKNKASTIYGTTLAYYLAQHNRFDLLIDILEKYPEIIDLNAGPKSEFDVDYGRTLAWLITVTGNWDLLEKLLEQGMTFDLEAAPKNKENPYFGLTISEMLRRKNKPLLEKCRRKFRELKKQEEKNRRARNSQNKEKENTESCISLISQKIKNNVILACELKRDLANIDNILQELNSEEIRNIFNESIPYLDYEETYSKRNLIKKFAQQILGYRNTILEKKELLSKYQQKLEKIQMLIKQLNQNVENKQEEKMNQEKLSKLEKSISKLKNNIAEDKRMLSGLKDNILKANERLEQNVMHKSKRGDFRSDTGVTLINSSNNKFKTQRPCANKSSSTTTYNERSETSAKTENEEGNDQTKQTNSKPSLANNAKSQQANVKSRKQRRREKKINSSSNISSKIDMGEKQPKTTAGQSLPLNTSSDKQPNQQESADGDIPVPFATTGLTLYYKPGTQPSSVVVAQPLGTSLPKIPKPQINTFNLDECLIEMKIRLTNLLCINEDGTEKEKEVDTLQKSFNEYMLKFRLLKFLECCYQYLKSVNDKNYKDVKGLRNLICHDHYSLSMEEISSFIKIFAKHVDNLSDTTEKEDLLSNIQKYVDALQESIKMDMTINQKIDDFVNISATRRKRQQSQTLFQDFIDPVTLNNNLQNDIQLIQYIFNVKINEMLEEENQGNALSIIKQFNPDLYSLCEFLIMSIYETMAKLKYYRECDIIREARNHISHDFTKLPVHLMQRFFAHDLPLITRGLADNEMRPLRSLV